MHRTVSAPPGASTCFELRPAVARALFTVGIVALIFGLWLRFGLVENLGLTRACLQDPGIACGIRRAAIEIFNHGLFGGVALAAALFNFWRPHMLTIATAVPAAMLGLVLYNTTLSAFAAGLTLLAFARPAGRRAQSTAPPPV